MATKPGFRATREGRPCRLLALADDLGAHKVADVREPIAMALMNSFSAGAP
jgi:hypothetical protein